MINTRDLLLYKTSLKRYTKNLEILGRITLGAGCNNYALGTPGVIAKLDGSVYCILPFPTPNNRNYPYIVSYRDSMGNETYEPDVVFDHEVVRIEEPINNNFLMNKKVSEFVRDRGAVTFFVEDVRHLEVFIRDLLGLYKYKILLELESFVSADRLVKIENIETTVSFFDLKHFIPTFDTRCVDGMGVMLKIGSGGNEIGNLFCSTYILSNYRRNVFYIDGIKLYKHKEIPDKHENSLLSFVKSRELRQKIPKKQEKRGSDKNYTKYSDIFGVQCENTSRWENVLVNASKAISIPISGTSLDNYYNYKNNYPFNRQ